MTSVVAICNLALSHLGDRATLSSIDPPEGSAQADHCAQFWPIARDEALTTYDWRFASTISELATLDDSVQLDARWTYAAALPADFLVARELVIGTDTVWAWVSDELPLPYEIASLATGQLALFSNEEFGSLRYTRVVTNTARWPAQLVTAVSYLLASYLAGPVVKGKSGVGYAKAHREAWERLSTRAAMTDANQHSKRSVYTPASVRARGYTDGLTRTIEVGQYRRELPYWAS